MALNFLTQSSYSHANFIKAIIGAASFWESKSDDTANVGGITISRSSNSISMSGFGDTITTKLAASGTTTGTKIAATENGLIFCYDFNGEEYVYALGVDADGTWGGVMVPATEAPKFITPGMSGTSGISILPAESSKITQMVPAVPTEGNMIFDNVYRVLLTPNKAYKGRLLIGNTNFLQLGGLSLRYKE